MTIKELISDSLGKAFATLKANMVAKTDIVANATTNDTTKPAAASVAKNLQDQIGTVPSGSTLQGQIDTLNSNKVSNQFIHSSGTINTASFTFPVPSSYSAGLFVANINGVGSQVGYYLLNANGVTLYTWSGFALYLSATYNSNNTITITKTAGSSIRDITVIVG